MREGPHALHGPPFGVQGDKVDRHFAGDFETGRAIFGHIGYSPNFLGRVGGAARDQRKLIPKRGDNAGRRGNNGRERAFFDLLDDADLPDFAAFYVRHEPLVDVLQNDRCPRTGNAPVLGQLDRLVPRRARYDGRPGNGANGLRIEEPQAVCRLNERNAVVLERAELEHALTRDEKMSVVDRKGRLVGPFDAVAVDARNAIHVHFRRDVADGLSGIGPLGAVDDTDRSAAVAVVVGGQGQYVLRAGNRTGLHERAGGYHSIAVKPRKPRAVGIDRPKTLDGTRGRSTYSQRV